MPGDVESCPRVPRSCSIVGSGEMAEGANSRGWEARMASALSGCARHEEFNDDVLANPALVAPNVRTNGVDRVAEGCDGVE